MFYYTFDSLAATAALEGSVRLPARHAGYFGSGACVDDAGPDTCITIETSPSGCPFEPDQCSQVKYEIFQWLNFIILSILKLCIFFFNLCSSGIHLVILGEGGIFDISNQQWSVQYRKAWTSSELSITAEGILPLLFLLSSYLYLYFRN